MERRLSERVQFFQLPTNNQVIPVWVFQRAHPESVPALLLDFSKEGVQILTDKSLPLPNGSAKLIIHNDDRESADFIVTVVRILWSKAEGALYTRNGCEFDPAANQSSQIEQIRVACEAGKQWLRCELAAT